MSTLTRKAINVWWDTQNPTIEFQSKTSFVLNTPSEQSKSVVGANHIVLDLRSEESICVLPNPIPVLLDLEPLGCIGKKHVTKT